MENAMFREREMRSVFKAIPFVNEFKQTVDPGDEVMYAGTSWHYTSFRKAKYEGVYTNPITGEVLAVKVSGVTDRWMDEGETRTAYLPLKKVFKLA
jgi:hypothetical protein